MTPVIKRLGFAGISALDMEWLKKRSPIGVIAPFYHLVSDEPVPHIDKLYPYQNSRQFEANLDELLRHFQPLGLDDIIRQQQTGRPFEKKGFLISFDDGLRQVYEVAAPILLRKGVPAALFLNPAFVDNKDIFYNFKKGLILDRLDNDRTPEKFLPSAAVPFGRKFDTVPQLRAAIRSVNYLGKQLMDALGPVFNLDFEAFRREQQPFMSTPQIKDLIAKGFGVGSHSLDHPLYSLLPPDEQLRHTRESTDWVVGTFSLPYKVFAFPHVDTGVRNDFFRQLTDPQHPELDLILGNSTGMQERHPRVLHRFIGENPAIPAATMVKSVLAYSALRSALGRPFVRRD